MSVEERDTNSLITGPPVTHSLVAAMLIVSLSTLVFTSLYGVYGGVGELDYPWQLLTSAFEHGWPGVPLLPHLIGNLILIWVMGRGAERLLGGWRFLALTAAALALYGITRQSTGVDANGASVFIWAYAPVVFVGRRRLRQVDDVEKYNVLLWVMWVVVPLAMGIIIAASTRIGFVLALLLGNAFHLSATLAGVGAALFWRRRLHSQRSLEAGLAPSRGDVIGRLAALLIPASMLALLIAWLVGLV